MIAERRSHLYLGQRLLVAGLGLAGLLALSALSALPTLRVSLAWMLLVAVPGWLVEGCLGWQPLESPLTRWGRRLVLGWTVLLASLGFCELAGVSHTGMLWVWGTACGLFAVGGMRHRATASSPGSWSRTAPLALVLVLAASVVAANPPSLSVESDLAAHLGAIQDSRTQGRWAPLDHSVHLEETRRDPRFGVIHGAHAAIASQLGLDVVTELRSSAAFFALSFLLAHAFLFTALGISAPLAVLAAWLFAAGASGGAPLGWWAGLYPSQVALGIGAGSVGLWLADAPGRDRTGRSTSLMAAVALGLSALVHPFAWWAFLLLLGHAGILGLFSARMREELPRLVAFLVGAGLVGAMSLLPLLSAVGSGESGQWELAGVLLIRGSWFTVDPLVLIRFGGALSLLAAPLILLGSGGAWREHRGMWIAFAATLPVWTVALNPLLQPWVFSQVGYLSERLGQLAWIPALGILLLVTTRSRPRTGSRRGILIAGAAALILFAGVPQALRAALHSPYRWGLDLIELGELSRELRAGALEQPACDPASSYGLRALQGGRALVVPVEHSSPLDTRGAWRLGRYRELFSPELPLSELGMRLRELGADALVIDTEVENGYRSAIHGFVPANERQLALLRRLEAQGLAPDASPGPRRIYRLATLERAEGGEIPTQSLAADSCSLSAREPVDGTRFSLVDLKVNRRAYLAGDEVQVQLCYAGKPGKSDAGGWEHLFLRFEGPMPVAPKIFEALEKPYRKLVLERSARSRARFGESWVPFDGYRDPGNWGEQAISEDRRVRLPVDLLPANYEIQPTVQAAAWRPVRQLGDFLSDEDSWTGPVWATITVLPGNERR